MKKLSFTLLGKLQKQIKDFNFQPGRASCAAIEFWLVPRVRPRPEQVSHNSRGVQVSTRGSTRIQSSISS